MLYAPQIVVDMLKMFLLCVERTHGTLIIWEVRIQKAVDPLFLEGMPSGRKKGGMTMVTYQDLIDFMILIVSLVGLSYEIFKDKK